MTITLHPPQLGVHTTSLSTASTSHPIPARPVFESLDEDVQQEAWAVRSERWDL